MGSSLVAAAGGSNSRSCCERGGHQGYFSRDHNALTGVNAFFVCANVEVGYGWCCLLRQILTAFTTVS